MSVQTLIEAALLKGLKKDEIEALYGLPSNYIINLEKNSEEIERSFKKAETEAFVKDLQMLRDNLENPKLNATAISLLFANRYGWSTKPARLSKPCKDASELAQAILMGEVDVEVGLKTMQVLAMKADMDGRQEERDKILPMIERLEAYAKANNL